MPRFGASLFPGTSVIDPPFIAEDRPILGLDAQLFIALVMLILIGTAVTIERFHPTIPSDPFRIAT